ncbi:MAG: glutaminyl-tRNA synthase (glutamine-hydrolyzing) subunit B [Actinobacteria bacterium RBG_16_68_21]|nr:MAG: glutaminyl-tRNA synthase (glutamine-hydrolyzing) subunit B [Actinobacteria bacterium RBG_16_68_21]
MNYEAVIGIETHVELLTHSKMFCGCPTDFGADPNTNVCPVCLGLPGALPVPNEQAIHWTIALGMALECSIAPHSVFHRKNYFYADLPKNYQISQFDLPLCVGGHLDVDGGTGERRVGITRVHLEEDTGKSTHLGGSGRIHDASGALIDFNRSGIPLMEVVTEPDIRTPEEARAYAQELRAIVLALGISDARLEEGSLRFDANVSLRPEGSTTLGTKVEVKNMNSLRSLQRALAFEIDRQNGVLAAGGTIAQETRHWDEAAGRTESGRGKEESSDYRYFPEPDLVPLEVGPELLARLRAGIPELPAVRRERYMAAGLDATAARTLVAGDLSGLFDDAVAAGAAPRAVANWLSGEVTAHLNRTGTDAADLTLDGAGLAELVEMVDSGEVSATAAKDVLAGVLAGEGTPRKVAERRDLLQISDVGALVVAVDEALAAHQDEVARIRGGDARLVGFLVGQVMKATGGRADPQAVDRLIRERTGA